MQAVPLAPGERLRVAYVSSDFGNHPLSHLMGSVFGLHDRSRVRLPSHQQCFSLHVYDHSPCSLPDRGDSVTLLPITYVKPIFGKLQWGAEHLKRLAGSSACCWECSEIAPESSMMRTGMHCAPNTFGLQIEPKVSCSRTMHRARWWRRWRFSAMRSAPQTAQSGGSALRGSLSTSWTSPRGPSLTSLARSPPMLSTSLSTSMATPRCA